MSNLTEGEKRIGVISAITSANEHRAEGRLGVLDLPRPDESSQRAIALIWPEDLRIWTEHFHDMDRTGPQWGNLQTVFNNKVLFAMPSNQVWKAHHELMISSMSARYLGTLPAVAAGLTDQLTSNWAREVTFDLTGNDITNKFLEIDMMAASKVLLGYPLEYQEMLEVRTALANLHAGAGASVEVNAIWAKPKGAEVFNNTTNAGLERLREFARAVRDRVQISPESSPVVAELIAKERLEHFGLDKTLHEIITVLLGSQSTMSSSQMSLLFLLSQPENHYWQENLRTSQGPDRERLVKAMYKEVLRLYPSIYVHSRDVTREFEFTDSAGNDIRLTMGDKIVIFPSVTQRLPDIWEDPDRFDPSRHTQNPSKKSQSQHPLIPFGFGPHVCIGAPTAMIGGPVPVVRILDQFETTVKEAYYPEPEYQFTMSPNRRNVYTLKPLA